VSYAQLVVRAGRSACELPPRKGTRRPFLRRFQQVRMIAGADDWRTSRPPNVARCAAR